VHETKGFVDFSIKIEYNRCRVFGKISKKGSLIHQKSRARNKEKHKKK
jgi:hypothetical protein